MKKRGKASSLDEIVDGMMYALPVLATLHPGVGSSPAFVEPLEPQVWAEAASSLVLVAVSIWTTSTAAHRALSTRKMLVETGEAQQLVETVTYR